MSFKLEFIANGWGDSFYRIVAPDGTLGYPARYDHPAYLDWQGSKYVAFSQYWGDGEEESELPIEKVVKLGDSEVTEVVDRTGEGDLAQEAFAAYHSQEGEDETETPEG